MTFAIGGSAKVRRVVKEARTKPWTCACEASVPWTTIDPEAGVPSFDPGFVQQPASLTRCPDCGTRRP